MNETLFSPLFDQFHVIPWLSYRDLLDQGKDPAEIKKSYDRPIVINTTGNPHEVVNILEITKTRQIHDHVQTILVNDPDVADQHPQLGLCCFPAIGTGTTEELKRGHYVGQPDWASRRHLWSCLNRETRPHRLVLAQLLHDMGLIGQGYFSFSGRFPHSEESFLSESGEEAAAWYWDNLSRFPILASTDDRPRIDHDPFSPGFGETYLNICAETSICDFCPTEKTWKHITAGCLSLTVSSPGFLQKMEKLGFDLWFDGLDLHEIDTTLDWRGRVTKVVECLRDILPDIPDIWRENLPRLKHNHDLMMSGDWTRPFYLDLRQILDPT